MRAACIALLVSLLCACSGSDVYQNELPNDEVSPAGAIGVPVENIDAHYTTGSIVADVISTGCTRAADFSVHALKKEQHCLLTLQRIQPDLCKRASFVHRVKISWPGEEECTDKEIIFTNPRLLND